MAAMSGPPVAPDAGHWQTWVLSAPDQVKVPAPPEQAATRQELAGDEGDWPGELDAATRDQIAYWDAGSPSYRWIEIALDQFRTKPDHQPTYGTGHVAA